MTLLSDETASNPTQDKDLQIFARDARFVRDHLGLRSIVLVGMMGSGKSSIGRRMALALNLPFFDADTEIERAAGMPIEEIFKQYGEAHFREGEERVIRRLLQGPPHILATGGGAVVSAQTRANIAAGAVSVWLDAPIDLLLKRVSRKSNRPLLKAGDPEAILGQLLNDRQTYYAEAKLRFSCRDAPHNVITEEVIGLVADYLRREQAGAEAGDDASASNIEENGGAA